jgi:hypothetical protein
MKKPRSQSFSHQLPKGPISVMDEELRMDRSDRSSDETVLSYEQKNPESFQCINCFRPLFFVLYYLFCCCLFPSCYTAGDDQNQNVFSSFKRTLKTLKKKRFADSEVFNAMVNLYRSKQSAFVLLTRVRLNPSN